MDTTTHNKLVAFIWSIADDCLRDVYVRGKYRDVILPMVVLRRIDALLEPTKDAVLEEVRFQREELEFTQLETVGLLTASNNFFYNTSKWTLQKLKKTSSNSNQIMQADFEEYLNGFSENVKEIIDKFNLKNQVQHMISKDVWLDVLEKFTSPSINLTPFEVEDTDGRKLPALSNLGMGYVFEELIRKFNEENNEEAGEHFTPREVIDLMTHLIFDPIKDNLPPVITIYDPACGSGGMLTEAQNFIQDEEGTIKATGSVHLFGKEINDETYAICQSDMMIRGNSPENIRVGSTLSTDTFLGKQFNYMLSNPPYGKSWASEQKYIKDGKDVIDSRFIVQLKDYWQNIETVDATPRSSDGQLLFLMEMVSKMKPNNNQTDGSRIASVHNGSSLFTGDAGGGESNIRRYIIENDLLEAIIQLPNNLFYNTGITTYIWLLSNAKKQNRKGKVQLIDASQQFSKLRKNLGAKNCELTPEHINEILKVYLNFENSPKNMQDTQNQENNLVSKSFDNQDFGFYKVVIERPKRLKAQFLEEKINVLRFDKSLFEPMQWAFETYGEDIYTKLKEDKKIQEAIIEYAEKNGIDLNATKRNQLTSPKLWNKQKTILEAAQKLMQLVGTKEYNDFNLFQKEVEKQIKEANIKLSSSEKNAIYNAITWYDKDAEKVIKKVQKLKDEKLDELLERLNCTQKQLADFGYFQSDKKDEYTIYETESDLRDYENIPLKSTIYDYFQTEVRPHVEEAWIDLEKTKIGYEISFNKYFYKHQPLRNIEEVSKEILELEKENEGLIFSIMNG